MSTTDPPTRTSPDHRGLSGTPTVLGPLTTLWTPPPACNMFQQFNYGDNVGGWNGRGCNDRGNQTDTSTCWPPASITAPPGTISNWGYYSPGLSCPVGYATACMSVNGPDNSSAPAPSGTSYWPFQYQIAANETAVGCCPSGYSCNTITDGAQTCQSIAFRQAVTFTEFKCDGSKFNTSVQSLPFTSRFVFVPTSTTVSSYQFFAPLYQLVHKDADFPPNSTEPSSAAPATSPNNSASAASSSSNTGGGGSLTKGGTVAIAVVIPVVVLAALIALIIWFLHRRKQRKQAEAAKQAKSDGVSPDLEDMTRDPGYGVGYGKQDQAPDTEMSGAHREHYSADGKEAVAEPSRSKSSRLGHRFSIRNYFQSEKLGHNAPSELDAGAVERPTELPAATSRPHEMYAGPVANGTTKTTSAVKSEEHFETTAEGTSDDPTALATAREAEATDRPESAYVQDIGGDGPDPQELETAKRISMRSAEAPRLVGSDAPAVPAVPTPPKDGKGSTGDGPTRGTSGTFFDSDVGSKPASPSEEIESPPLPIQGITGGPSDPAKETAKEDASDEVKK